MERLKANRSLRNKTQVRAYSRLLDYISKRYEPCSNPEKQGKKIAMHEKEREFFDCLRLIIRNGYELSQQDCFELLGFIGI